MLLGALLRILLDPITIREGIRGNTWNPSCWYMSGFIPYRDVSNGDGNLSRNDWNILRSSIPVDEKPTHFMAFDLDGLIHSWHRFRGIHV